MKPGGKSVFTDHKFPGISVSGTLLLCFLFLPACKYGSNLPKPPEAAPPLIASASPQVQAASPGQQAFGSLPSLITEYQRGSLKELPRGAAAILDHHLSISSQSGHPAAASIGIDESNPLHHPPAAFPIPRNIHSVLEQRNVTPKAGIPFPPSAAFSSAPSKTRPAASAAARSAPPTPAIQPKTDHKPESSGTPQSAKKTHALPPAAIAPTPAAAVDIPAAIATMMAPLAKNSEARAMLGKVSELGGTMKENLAGKGSRTYSFTRELVMIGIILVAFFFMIRFRQSQQHRDQDGK